MDVVVVVAVADGVIGSALVAPPRLPRTGAGAYECFGERPTRPPPDPTQAV